MRNAPWLLLVVAVVGAAAGRLDPARFTKTITASDHGGLRLEYSRVGPAGSLTHLRLWVDGAVEEDGKLRVRLDGRYTRRVRIDRISPEPTEIDTDGDDMVFVFAAPARRPALIELDVQYLDLGRQDGRLAVAGASPLAFTQYVVP